MKEYLLLLVAYLTANAQTHFHIHITDGSHSDVPIAKIDNITLVGGDTIPEVA